MHHHMPECSLQQHPMQLTLAWVCARTVSMGMAKPTPALVPVGVKMAVFCMAHRQHTRPAVQPEPGANTCMHGAPMLTNQGSFCRCRADLACPQLLPPCCLFSATHHAYQAPTAVEQRAATVACVSRTKKQRALSAAEQYASRCG